MPPPVASRANPVPDLPYLTGIRFLAAFWVLGFHTMPRTGLPRPVVAFWNAGFSGVSLFFVLSGFILAHVYGNTAATVRPFPARRFLVARFARVYPAYAAALVFAVPLLVHDLRTAVNPPAGVVLSGVCFTSITMLQAWIPGWGCWWNCPGWSLSAEAFFYLSFPFIAPALMRLRPGALAAVAGAALLFAFAVGASQPDASRAVGATQVSWAVRLWLTPWTPLVRLPEFVLGICAARLLRTAEGRPRVGALGGWLAAAVVVAATVLPSPWQSGLLLWPGLALPFAVIVASLSTADGRGLLASPALQRLGNASYSLYLIHSVGHGYYLAAVNRLIGRTFAVSWTSFLVYAGLIIGASLVMHDVIEMPARLRFRRAFA